MGKYRGNKRSQQQVCIQWRANQHIWGSPGRLKDQTAFELGWSKHVRGDCFIWTGLRGGGTSTEHLRQDGGWSDTEHGPTGWGGAQNQVSPLHPQPRCQARFPSVLVDGVMSKLPVNGWIYNGVGRERGSLPSHRLRKWSLLNKYNEEVWKANISLISFRGGLKHPCTTHMVTRNCRRALGRLHLWTPAWRHQGHVCLLFTFNYVHLKVMKLSFIFLCLIYVMLTGPACKLPLKT